MPCYIQRKCATISMDPQSCSASGTVRKAWLRRSSGKDGPTQQELRMRGGLAPGDRAPSCGAGGCPTKDISPLIEWILSNDEDHEDFFSVTCSVLSGSFAGGVPAISDAHGCGHAWLAGARSGVGTGQKANPHCPECFRDCVSGQRMGDGFSPLRRILDVALDRTAILAGNQHRAVVFCCCC